MSQTRTHSILESLANVVIGYTVALCTQIVVYPAYGLHVPASDQLAIGGWFTIVSIARSYCLRRWFNRRIATK